MPASCSGKCVSSRRNVPDSRPAWRTRKAWSCGPTRWANSGLTIRDLRSPRSSSGCTCTAASGMWLPKVGIRRARKRKDMETTKFGFWGSAQGLWRVVKNYFTAL
eukprot:scaffold1452_cov236-Pinguiococcus_pyrenoidosus.AAC.12